METLELEVAPEEREALSTLDPDKFVKQIELAKKYPRDIVAFKKKILALATADEETAAVCFYVLKRKGKDGEKTIQGPSVRLAELAVFAAGNLIQQVRVTGNDGKKITAVADVFDLENLTGISVEVDRSILTKEGKTYSEDMQVVVGNAARAIALRNAVFKVIPAVFIKQAYEAAIKTATGDARGIPDRFQRATEQFAKINVDRAALLKLVGRTSEKELTVGDIQVLIGAYNAIKQGDSTIEEMFTEAEKTNAPEFKK